jgi:hypothetical protein
MLITRLIPVLLLACSTSAPTAAPPVPAAPPAPPPVVAAPPVGTTPPATAAPTGTFSAEVLKAQAGSLTVYPPTACRLRALLGPAFSDLVDRSGGYGEEVRPDGGVLAAGAVCPQTYCDHGASWIHPDGGMVVAIRNDETLSLYTNRPALADKLPASMTAFIDEERGREPFKMTWKAKASPEPAACANLEAETARFLAARDGTGCDAQFSQFYEPAIVAPQGERANFRDTPTSEPRKTAVVAGDVVLLTQAKPGAYACAQYRALSGAVTVGWLAEADLRRAPIDDDTRDAAAKLHPVAAPGWLGASDRTFGDAKLRSAGAGLHVELDRVMSGHMCSVSDDLERVSPGLYRTNHGEDDCNAVVATFANGVLLWSSRACEGARASCSDAYLPTPK